MSRRGEGLLLLTVLVVIWGGNYTWVKVALADMAPLTFNTLRYGAAAILMALVAATRGSIRDSLPERDERLRLALIGVLQIGVVTACSTLALRRIEATRVVLIIYSMPIWTLLLSAALFGERASARTLAGVALGAAGLALLTNPLAMAWTADTLPGVLLALASVLGWAWGALLYRARQWRSGLWSQVFWQIAVSVCFMIPFTLAFELGRPVNVTPALLATLFYNAIVPSVVGFWCWSQALARVSVAHASQFLLLSPVFGLIQNNIVLGEPVGPATFVAAGCILAGASLSLRTAPTPGA